MNYTTSLRSTKMFDLVFPGVNLFVLYIALSANFLAPLLPHNISPLLKDSMGLRHLIAFLGLVLLMVVSEANFDNLETVGMVLLASVFIYFWFMLASKMTANWWVFLVMAFAALYLVHIYKAYTKKPSAETKQYLEYAETAGLALSVVLTVVGFVIFVGEKKIEYRGKFDFTTLLLGTPTNKMTPTKTPYFDSLKAAFLVAPGSGSGSSGYGSQRGGFMSSDDSIAPVSSFDFVAAT